MAKTYANQDPISALYQHCEAISLPHNLKQSVVKDIEKWYKNNGPYYVVDRLKFIKQCAVKYLTSGELPPKDASIWFRRNKDGLLYGHWATLMKLMKTQKQDVMKLLQGYTVFATDKKPSKKSIQKFRDTIEKPFSGDPVVLNEVSFYLYRDSRIIVEKYLPTDKKYLVRSDVALPGPYLLHARFNNESHRTNIHKNALDTLYQPAILNHALQMPWIADVIQHDVRGGDGGDHYYMGADFDNVDAGVINYRPTIVGRVNVINEPGLKERIVTDFDKVCEHLTFPLGKRLYDIVKYLPWDSTFNEEQGYKLIQSALKRGQTCYCYDMTSATDRFPVALQEWVLKSLNLGPHWADQLSLLKTMIHSKVKLPDGQLSEWAVGQPMGAFPSFAMFTLTHGLLLMQYLYSKGEEYNGQFVVHGDDIVIMDDELADYYKITFDYLDGNLNDFKTVISCHYAEFNSRLITASGFIYMRKYRPVTLDNVMDQVTFWGPKCIDWLPNSNRVKQEVTELLSVPCVLPDGNSINPRGLSAVQRVLNLPLEVLNVLLTTDSKAMNYESNRNIAIQHLRNNKWSELAFENEVSEVYGTAILQMHLAALQYSDTLDREILDDSSNFIDFFNMDKADVNALSIADTIMEDETINSNEFSVAQSMFEVLGHMKKSFEEIILEDSDISVSIANIRSYNLKQSLQQRRSSSKVFKALRLLERARSHSERPKLKQA